MGGRPVKPWPNAGQRVPPKCPQARPGCAPLLWNGHLGAAVWRGVKKLKTGDPFVNLTGALKRPCHQEKREKTYAYEGAPHATNLLSASGRSSPPNPSSLAQPPHHRPPPWRSKRCLPSSPWGPAKALESQAIRATFAPESDHLRGAPP